MARRSKVVFCLLLAFLYVVVNVCPLRAEALPEVMEGSATLADCIMTYYALSGNAIADSNWINTLYNSYGSTFGTIEELAQQGYLILNDSGVWEPAQSLIQNIEQAPAYASLSLNEMFSVSAQEVAAGGGLAVASGGSILAGSLGGVASTGVVPLLGGVTAAYWGGIALGTLIAHGLGLYSETIYNAQTISDAQAMEEMTGYGVVSYTRKYSGDTFQYFNGVQNARGIIVYETGITSRGEYIYYIPNFGGYKFYKSMYSTNGVFNQPSSTQVKFTNGYHRVVFSPDRNVSNPHPYMILDSGTIDDYWNDLVNGVKSFPLNRIMSPDSISENGNNIGEYDSQNDKYTVPDMKPQIDPGTQAGKPLTLQDWQNFANAVKNNNSNADPAAGRDANKGLFQDILDLIRTVIPENVPNPNPNPNPDPYSPPVVTPVPDPSYPDPVPDQQITENPQESENPQQTENPIDTGKPWRLPDLRQKFPFCIPWDIAKIFSKLKVNARQAPHISWRFNPPNTPIDYTFNLDLEDFEEAAALLRTLELMGFIVGLAFATRYLIGAN